MYSYGGHLDHVNITIYANLQSHFLPEGFFLMKVFEFFLVIYMYIAPWQVLETHYAHDNFININLLSICSFLASFLPLTDPRAGPFLTPKAWLAGFIKRTTTNCYIKNMKALGLVVS